ncbi:hypothetical protein PXK56_18240 [Phaeobacter gallaeciensis]|uniref:hypothetical protein n=1 Tax=Phaeobacter gallaeciensis TaxID=60890 RepID=UPI00238051CE|nr:hypothetical protein [Phaeobacter gallaeciensis]MDE4297127.1 hypothetical protein [Phaeobacter gallaeciensis]
MPSTHTKRFFDTTEDFIATVLAGEPIDCAAGSTDGDHISWLLEAFKIEDLGLISFATLFSSRVTTLEQAQNVASYFDSLFRAALTFNIEQGGADESGISETEAERIAFEL